MYIFLVSFFHNSTVFIVETHFSGKLIDMFFIEHFQNIKCTLNHPNCHKIGVGIVIQSRHVSIQDNRCGIHRDP